MQTFPGLALPGSSGRVFFTLSLTRSIVCAFDLFLSVTYVALFLRSQYKVQRENCVGHFSHSLSPTVSLPNMTTRQIFWLGDSLNRDVWKVLSENGREEEQEGMSKKKRE